MEVWKNIKEFYSKYKPYVNLYSTYFPVWTLIQALSHHFNHLEFTHYNPNPTTSAVGLGCYLAGAVADQIITRRMLNLGKEYEEKFGETCVSELSPVANGMVGYKDVFKRYALVIPALSCFSYLDPSIGITVSVVSPYLDWHNLKIIKKIKEDLEE